MPPHGNAVKHVSSRLTRGWSHSQGVEPCPIRPRRRSIPPRLRAPLVVRRATAALRGRIRVPGDKSISHRALMFAGLAVGDTRITGLLEGEDVLRTAAAMRALGAEIVRQADDSWHVTGRGIGRLLEPDDVLDMGNSGTAARLLTGLLASHPDRLGDDRRCEPARPSDAPGHRSARAYGCGVHQSRRGAIAALHRRMRRTAGDLVSPAGGVGAGEVGDPAGGPERFRRDGGRGAGADPRPQREHAAPFRRRGQRRGRWQRPRDPAARPSDAAGPRRGGAVGSVLGGVPDGGGTAGVGLVDRDRGGRGSTRCAPG